MIDTNTIIMLFDYKNIFFNCVKHYEQQHCVIQFKSPERNKSELHFFFFYLFFLVFFFVALLQWPIIWFGQCYSYITTAFVRAFSIKYIPI